MDGVEYQDEIDIGTDQEPEKEKAKGNWPHLFCSVCISFRTLGLDPHEPAL
jgi:hypothetical protein